MFSSFKPVSLAVVAGGILLMAGARDAAATYPASDFNHDKQKRTHTRTKLKNGISAVVPLRFPDFSPTGFYARGDNPSTNGSFPDCVAGTVELDAQEILQSEQGRLYFRPGGNFYKDSENNGQYGHIWIADLAESPGPYPQNINGQSCVASTVEPTDRSYYITPTRIPSDMYYKPGFSGSKWYTYGNPGYDKTSGRGDWTYIVWSVVQNGGSSYPDNITAGGGLVRALGKRDRVFHRCDVSSLKCVSYGPDEAKNGTVTSIYGKTRCDATGSWIYGWLVHSYKKTYESTVYCVRTYP